ncbi:ABC transporter ATP-binding protein [Flavitalea sp. BT771]|uniref:ABC transporter ATP-binding protein n=1 Tax=Flavitalea sp. BT771 TaxID=3063329 RepID=UPI0026E437D8|nr:ABC transporter ATP-binding protein [Flavitalea sp. BT771]MDO6431759.1 ABC transporter ATP-binding protein [Flavitalea sp. BT771]MDV6220667.1 ABC transporter ATP-binding protein [Flavitalea sp. BT771]
MEKTKRPPKGPGLSSLLKPYRGLIALLAFLAFLSNGLSLALPKIIGSAIDGFDKRQLDMHHIVVKFLTVTIGVFVFAYLQSIVQTFASERVARDLRTRLSEKISRQSYEFLQKVNPSALLTNLTADVDSIKMYVAQAIVSILSSLVTIIGVSILVMTINWKLGLIVIAIIPIIGITFFIVLRKVRALFLKSREVIDRLNKVINESILGAAIIRVVNSQQLEYNKFLDANSKAMGIGLSILRLFASLIPVIIFTANMATLSILALGGHFVITGSMSLGDFSAFNNYLAMLIFPILIIGFMSNVIAQAQASYARINGVLNAPDPVETGTLKTALKGEINVKDITVTYNGKTVLKDISFTVDAGSRTAIIGPTAAGKTQLLHLLTALTRPDAGTVEYDGHPIADYEKETLHKQIGFVFQDSIIFNMSIRENIAFNEMVKEEDMQKAIDTAELHDFIDALPEKLETVVSERGTSLSGGQKQRIMLARALAINPQVLLLDDFTARVDASTEQKILENVRRNYPGITLLSVTQKIASIEDYHQIILLMEGELIASGTHQELMDTCPEYVQIYQSQRSTSHYEQHELQS